MLQLFSNHQDNVINSIYITAQTSYKIALEHIVPLMNKLPIQRKIQKTKFYERLEKDIINGCIMPPLTLAFVENGCDFSGKKLKDIEDYVNNNLEKAFVLDGIQRLNTLNRASQNKEFNENYPIFFNILICPSNDKLLYRMITLNNGQKPMSTRHQVEILLANLYNFDDNNNTIEIISEKETIGKNSKTSFKKSSFINGYLAFLSNSINIDNKKIIESKLDELLGSQIMEYGVKNTDVEFNTIIETISVFSQSDIVRKWYQNENNLIGFCVANREKKCFDNLTILNSEEFEAIIDIFEKAFNCLEKSKIRIGTYRRKLSLFFFKKLTYITENKLEEAELLNFLLNFEME